jgi:FkbM family methyltransferase
MRKLHSLRTRLFRLRHRVEIRCPTECHGNPHAEWTICPDGLNDTTIVYSLGIGEDISFDRSLIEKYGVSVFAFDPTPRAITWLKSLRLPSQFRYFEYGVADYDGTAAFFPPENPDHISHSLLPRAETARQAIRVEVRRLGTLMTMLGHGHIDILKLDIEGAEYAVLADMLTMGIAPAQVVVEFHHRFLKDGFARTHRMIRKLNRQGYRIFHVSPSSDEFSFIKR